MRKVTQAIYDRIDNGVYAVQSDQWWLPESAWYQMTVSFNPVRVGYAKRKLLEELKIDPLATAWSISAICPRSFPRSPGSLSRAAYFFTIPSTAPGPASWSPSRSGRSES